MSPIEEYSSRQAVAPGARAEAVLGRYRNVGDRISVFEYVTQ
jgi:hypothetical protein